MLMRRHCLFLIVQSFYTNNFIQICKLHRVRIIISLFKISETHKNIESLQLFDKEVSMTLSN